MPTSRKNPKGVAKFSPTQYRVTQSDGTKRPFADEHSDNREAGLDVDVILGEPLFASFDKVDSGTRWASFTEAEGARVAVSERFFLSKFAPTPPPGVNFQPLAKSSSALCLLRFLVDEKGRLQSPVP